MQHTSWIALVVVAAVPALGQLAMIVPVPNTPVTLGGGKPPVLEVQFGNLVAGAVNAPIYDLDGVTGLAGASFHVELCYDASPIGGAPESVAGASATFLSKGYFMNGSRLILGFDTNDGVTVWVRAWAGDAGSTFAAATHRAESNRFPLTVPNPNSAPPPVPQVMNDLDSFSLQLVPEPSALALGSLLGVAALGFVVVRRKYR